MRACGIRLVTIGLFLTSVTFVAAQAASVPTAGPFEALPHFEASAILPGSPVQGPHYRVEERVDNDGLASFHRTRAPLARLLLEAGGAGALTVDNRVLQILDYMVWTADLAAHAGRITAQARTALPGAKPEVWLTGQVSQRTRDELRARGWTVHEGGLRLDPQWP